MKTVGEFLAYWWANVKTAKHNYEVLAVVIMSVIGAGAFIADYVGLSSGKPIPELLHVLEILSIGFFAVWLLLWLPFRRHKTQEASCNGRLKELQTRMSELTDQDANLEKQKKEQAIRRQCLATCIEALNDRTVEIRKMGYIKYCGEYHKQNSATLQLIDNLCGALREQFGDEVITLFRRSKPTPLSEKPTSEAEGHWQEHLSFIDGKMEELKTILSRML